MRTTHIFSVQSSFARHLSGIATFVFLAGSVIAQNQLAALPSPFPSAVQNQSKMVSGAAPVNNLTLGGTAVPAFIANNAPDVAGIIGDREQMKEYVAANPNSPYTSWLENSLATMYRNAGRITPALNHWNTVWQRLKDTNDPESRKEANHALAGQAELLTMLGRVGELHDLLQSAEGRAISDPADRERIEKAREGYVMMLRYPELNFRCGTLALAEIARMQDKPASTIDALIQEPSPKEGISLLRLVQLSRQYNLGLVAVKRTDSTPLPTPCIVHWAQNHYGALLEYRADLGSYRAIFGEPNWIAAPDVDAEASGYFLIPENQRPASWPVVSDAECSQVLGRSFIYSINDSKDKGCKIKPTDTVIRCPNCPDAKGMPAWWVSEPYINVWLADEPVSYTTSHGEDFPFRVTVKQRDSLGTVFTYPRPGLLHNWYSRIYIQGMPLTYTQYVTNYSGTNITGIVTNHPPVLETNGFGSWTATVDLPTGGQVTYNSSSNWTSSYDEETKTTLAPVYGKMADGTQYPIPGYPFGGTGVPADWTNMPQPGASSAYGYNDWKDGATGFRVFHPDGSVDRYGIVVWRPNATTGYYEEEALLTQHTDPLGNDANLSYEVYSNSFFRLTQVVDYDNKTNKFVYFSTRSNLLQQIVTPYNQTGTFAYDSSGNLTNITDAVTNSSRITWDANGRVSTLNTPYGTTGFNYYDADLPSTNDSTLNGDIPVNRSVTVVDPNGGANIYAYCFDSQTGAGTPSQFDSSVIPQNTPLGTLDAGTNEVGHDYAAVCFRNSFHWDSREVASLSTTNVGSMNASDFAKARMQHWLGDSNNVYQTSLLSVEQDPSPDGTTAGQLTFYDYYGKTLKFLQGTNSQVAVIARRLPSGQTYYDWEQYNSDGYVTKDISTYSLANGTVGTRTNSFIYGTNKISYTIYNNITGFPVVTPKPFYLNDGAYGYSYDNGDGLYDVPTPATPLFDVTLSIGNYCGAWSAYYASTSTVSSASLLIASIDASGATNQYGGYATVTKTLFTRNFVAWYNNSEPYFNQLNTATYTWPQSVIKTYTVPLPTYITNAVGYVTTLTYDGNNRLTSIHSPAGLTATNIYDSTGFLTKAIDLEIGRTNLYTYTNGLVRTWTNERGLLTTFSWDKLNRLTSQSDQEGYISNVYARLDLTASRDKLGNWSYFGYDPLQHLIAITNANQEVTLASYCSCGALEWIRDPMQNFTTFNSDLSGRVTNIDYPDGYIINSAYNSLNQLVKTSDGLGYATNSYNVQGLLTVSANAVGIIRSNAYDILDRPISGADNRGITTLSSYDSISRVLTNVVVGIATNSFIYSANGLVQSLDGLRQNITRLQNDVLGRILFRTNANTEVTKFQYDSSGNITNLMDGKLQRTSFQYDAFNRLTNKLDNTLASVLTLTYDADSRIKTLWTPGKGTITYIRDPMGRIRTNSFPSDPAIIKTYNANGQLINMVDGLTASGLGSTVFTYTLSGQPQNEGGLWPNDTVARTYNNRLRSGLSVGSYSANYYFDAAHRLQTIQSTTGTFGYTYHPGIGGSYSSPLVQRISLPNGMSITNGYDNGGRETATVMLNSSLTTVDSEQYGFNADNWRTNETRFDGSSVAYGYDHVGQLKTANAKEAGGTVRLNEQFGYAYDAAGNLNNRTNSTLTETFGVNSINELSTATPSGALTAAGNTAQTATSVSVNGQAAAIYGDKTFATTAGLSLANGTNTFTTIVQYASQTITNFSTSQLPTSVAFQYDGNGNLTNDGLRSFSYNDANHLVEVAIPGQAKSDLFYDGLGRRRIERDYVWAGTWTPTNEIHYIYDGNLVVQERDANNNVLVTYDRGLDLSGDLQGAFGIGGLLARTDIKGTVFYHSDAIGNVTTLFDKYQTLEGRYLYDSFGNIVGKWGGYADVNRYRFSSKEFNPLGLYDFGGRYYDPNLQRFVNHDPLGEIGGVNLYGYVGNNPINFIDPYGLSWFSDFGDWELGAANKAKEFFTGNPCDYHLDPNSLQYLSNQAGVGVTPLTDKNGNPVDAADLALDVFAQPLIALATGGLGDLADVADLAAGGEVLTSGGEVAATAKAVDTAALVDRAQEIHSALNPIAQEMRTTAALDTSGARVIAAGGRDLTPAQRALVGEGEVAAKLPGAHAEVTALQYAAQNGLTPQAIGVTRAICPACQAAIRASGGTLTSPTTAVWPR
jgi:RHS repeat-associated protein